ncbi:MAG: flavodoxin family protein [Dethiobacter sp.]|jgi:multimeric flavodoxin WrbA|nr:flavodoxin family protein [Dethiobacter sp.]MBS4023994.1 flavodoxin family protein [Dethiobacter sp.]
MAKIMVITSSPNSDGLTAACGEEARQGAQDGGADTVHFCLNDLEIGKCSACGSGWGTCRQEHYCQVEDDFQKLHSAMGDMDAFIFITPVYWWDLSESAKAFFDRVRRCECRKETDTYIKGKPVICVAAAGGTGNGFLLCLASMERFVDHVRGSKFDFIGVTRKNSDYKLKTIREAANKLAASL